YISAAAVRLGDDLLGSLLGAAHCLLGFLGRVLAQLVALALGLGAGLLGIFVGLPAGFRGVLVRRLAGRGCLHPGLAQLLASLGLGARPARLGLGPGTVEQLPALLLRFAPQRLGAVLGIGEDLRRFVGNALESPPDHIAAPAFDPLGDLAQELAHLTL